MFIMDNQYTVMMCDQCGTQYLDPQPTDAKLSEIYSEDYFLGGNSEEAQAERHRMKTKTAMLMLDDLLAYQGEASGKLLEIGCGQGEFLVEAEARGYQVTGLEYSQHAAQVAESRLQNGQVIVGDLLTANLPDNSFDVIVHTDVIEHVRDPHALLQEMHRLLTPNGILQMTTISLRSSSYRLLRRYWMEYKVEHLFYFSDNILYTMMYKTGFRRVQRQGTYKILTPEYIKNHFVRYAVPVLTPLMQLGHQVLPPGFRRRDLKLRGSGVTFFATAAERRKPKLSVIVPAYNEAGTFTELMSQLKNLDLGGMDIDYEIIIVESGSTDGTREQALALQDQPHVKVVLQDAPRGKGAAVREGLENATGDIIIIQDADLEYDVSDYETLLQPMLDGKAAFVLGIRHVRGSNRRVRHFTTNPRLSTFMNVGHVFFQGLLNLTTGSKMRDPFTMYKIFWRDAIHNVRLEANRFDFDFELVIKLLRRGFVPYEIPVNYNSRSFEEGKKVRLLRDPLTWLVALVKFRFGPMYKPQEEQRDDFR